MSMIERVARAMAALTNQEHWWVEWTDDARAAIAAMKYRDGEDEPLLIEAAKQEQMDPVGLSSAWDAMIDAALREGGQ